MSNSVLHFCMIYQMDGSRGMTIGSKLKQMRLKKGESLQGVADGVGASKAHIWEIETGKSRNPSLDLLNRIADHFGTTVAELVGEKPNSKSDDQELLTLYRDLKRLPPKDRDLIQSFVDTLKKRRHESNE